MGAFTNTIGTLTVTAAAGSTLALGSGKLSLADSSAITWNGTLTLTNALVEQSVRFGTTKTALTRDQLNAIDYNNGERVRLDKDGYLTTKPLGTIILFR